MTPLVIPLAYFLGGVSGAGVTLLVLRPYKRRRRVAAPASVSRIGTGTVTPPRKADLHALVDRVAKEKGAAQIEDYGRKLSSKGFLVLAQRLSQIAKNKGRKYVIRPGDTGQKLAKLATGDFRNWPDLDGVGSNKGTLRLYTDGAGYKQFKPWFPGLVIDLPPSWEMPRKGKGGKG